VVAPGNAPRTEGFVDTPACAPYARFQVDDSAVMGPRCWTRALGGPNSTGVRCRREEIAELPVAPGVHGGAVEGSRKHGLVGCQCALDRLINRSSPGGSAQHINLMFDWWVPGRVPQARRRARPRRPSGLPKASPEGHQVVQRGRGSS
jgi:hypothetical protein